MVHLWALVLSKCSISNCQYRLAKQMPLFPWPNSSDVWKKTWRPRCDPAWFVSLTRLTEWEVQPTVLCAWWMRQPLTDKYPANPCSEKPCVHSTQWALTWKSESVCVISQAQKRLCHPKAAQVSDIICPNAALQGAGIRAVYVVSCVCMRHMLSFLPGGASLADTLPGSFQVAD